MSTKFDWITVVLAILLFATLTAFFVGVFPYPYGWIIIGGLLALRLSTRQKRKRPQ